jgi:hypothetical protein
VNDSIDHCCDISTVYAGKYIHCTQHRENTVIFCRLYFDSYYYLHLSYHFSPESGNRMFQFVLHCPTGY